MSKVIWCLVHSNETLVSARGVLENHQKKYYVYGKNGQTARIWDFETRKCESAADTSTKKSNRGMIRSSTTAKREILCGCNRYIHSRERGGVQEK